MADSVDQVEESKEVFSDLERVVPVLLRRTVEAVLAEELGMTHFMLKVSLTSCIDDALI